MRAVAPCVCRETDCGELQVESQTHSQHHPEAGSSVSTFTPQTPLPESAAGGVGGGVKDAAVGDEKSGAGCRGRQADEDKLMQTS